MFVLEYVMTFVLQWWNASGVSCGERTVLAQIFLLLHNLREREITFVGSTIAVLVSLQEVQLHSAFDFSKHADLLSSEQYSIHFVL